VSGRHAALLGLITYVPEISFWLPHLLYRWDFYLGNVLVQDLTPKLRNWSPRAHEIADASEWFIGGVRMFCTQCGHEFGTADSFCATCGTSSERVASSPAAALGAPVANGITIPAFGRAKLKWWGHLPPVKANFPEPYSWLLKDITLTVFENYLTVTPGSEHRSEAADIATGGGMPLVSLVAGSVRSVKDKVVTALGTPSSEAFQQSFAAGELLWCRKNEAEVWEFQQKRFLGLKTPSRYALICRLTSTSTKIRFVFPLDRTQETFFDPVSAIGCHVTVKANGIREDEMVAAYADAVRSFFARGVDGEDAL